MLSTVVKFVLVVSLAFTMMVFVLFGMPSAFHLVMVIMTVIVFVFQLHGFGDDMTGGSC